MLDETVYIPFEMLTLPAPSGYEQILTQCFRDWRTPIITYTHGAIYDTEHPYTDYIRDGSLVNFPTKRECM